MRLGARELIFLCMMLGLLCCTWFFVFKKSEDKRLVMIGDIETKEKALRDLNAATVGVEDLNRKIKDLQQAITFFNSKLPAQREIDSILTEVTHLAEANSLQTTTFKPLRNEHYSNYSEQPIEMTLIGDFNGYYSFLLELEKLPRLTRISQMNLARISDRDGEMTAKLVLSIFYEPESKTIASSR